MTKRLALAGILAVGLPMSGFAQQQQQPEDDDGPGRGVARVSLINGDVSVRRGDSGDWTAASINAPLVVQDRLLTGASSRAEVQFDYANMLRVGSRSEVQFAEIEQRRYIVQIPKGLVTFRVLRDSEADVEVSTPVVSVRPSQRGEYRVEVRDDGTVEITVRSGEAQIFSPSGAQRLRPGKTMLVRGGAASSADPEFQLTNDIPRDDWDRWNDERDRTLERSRSYQYVSSDVYGAEDLDAHGRWVNSPNYGYVWTPNVSAGWAPYRVGRWAWVDWYGWTWVSADPWGWAPYHYGRWFWDSSFGWAWWPGARTSRHFWRPALVAFFGWNSYSGFSAGVGFGYGRIGWCPLAPYEIYRPWYGRNWYNGYGNRGGYVDNSVRIVNNVNITNIYRNSRVNNGVTAIDGRDFQSGYVRNYHSLQAGELQRASSFEGRLPVVPGRESLRLSDRDAAVRSDRNPAQERFYSRRAPAQVERVGFEQQRRSMEQISRGAITDGNSGGGRSMTGGGADRADGWRRFGEPSTGSSSRVGNSSVGRDENGWRRLGSSERDAVVRGGETGGGGVSRGMESGRGTFGGRASGDEGSWRRRSDDSSAGGGYNSRAAESGSRGGGAVEGGSRPSRRGSDSGWGSFSRGSGDVSGGSSRAMESGSRSAGSDTVVGGGGGEGGSSRRRSDSGWGSFGRGDRRSEDVRVAPEIVRERPSYSSGGGEGSMRRGGGGSSADSGGWFGRGSGGRSSESSPSGGGGWSGRGGGGGGRMSESAPSGGGGGGWSGGRSSGGGGGGGRSGGEGGGGRMSGGGGGRIGGGGRNR